jgi:ABC-type nickel/cobalt efflux system permease component RcnA
MAKFWKIFSIAVVLMWFFLGFYLLLSHRFDGLTKEIRVIFAVFMFLYGSWRLARIIVRDREEKEED